MLEIVHQKPNPVGEFTRRIMQTRGTCIEEVVREHVLPLLPAKSLCRFKAVCRGWNQWISSPFLAHKQAMLFQRISGFFCQKPGYGCHFIPLDPKTHGMRDPYLTFMPGPVNIRSICNGLLCVQGVDDTYYICNPVTKYWKMLPNPSFYHGPGTVISLAFEPSMFNFTENFELVCAVPVTDAGCIVFEIFSSRSRTWRASDDICFELANATFIGDACYRDGSAYWVVDCGVILVFNLKIDHYSIIQLPDGSCPNGIVTEMHGELCYVAVLREGADLAIHIYGGMDMNSRHRICIPWACPGNVLRQVRLMGCVDGDVLLVSIGDAVISHCVSTGETRMLGVDRMRGECTMMRYLPYVNSLVDVNELPELCDNLESMEFRP
ncbi:F-box protein At5g49610-like isoform X2 [Rhodamnia argentea]|uniref:F-box protein At5g49610-like isoform X2 n=1 Tax=Rhodamnia argentea TaxID=178133 RepID=A0ABM3GVJ0_9MYRT|nr:F-box protein At5g49610-like isoform X2 [Rhodamnia argentea]